MGKTAFVTGGSRGIGRAVVRRLAAELREQGCGGAGVPRVPEGQASLGTGGIMQ